MPTLENAVWLDSLTIGQVLAATASRFPDREAVVFPALGRRWTYSQFAAEVRKAAKGLLALGIEPGEHIGVWATNLPEWVALQYAAASAGAVLVTINPAHRAYELGETIARSDLVALFLGERFRRSDYYAIVEEICPQAFRADGGRIESAAYPKLRLAIALKEGAPARYLGWGEMGTLGESVTDETLDRVASSLSNQDVINIQYTSGSTGFPKAAMLTHRNILMNAWHVTGCQNITEADRMCVPAPLHHCFGCVMGSLGAVTRGAALVFPAEHFDPAATLSAIESERCTTIYGVPTMFAAMLNQPDLNARDLSSLRSGIMAGSPCPIEIMKRVVSVMGCREITIAYGQTETSPVLTQSRVDDPIELRVETIGRELPGVEIKIVDPQSGRTLPDGQQGEIWARGHGVMRGYYQDPEATARTIDAEGFVHTGDLGIRRPDGCYKITGRLKDVVIRGGENIYPREIEELLFAHPAIAQAAVFGVPDEKYGEAVCAWVQLREGHQLSEEDVRAFCKARLAHYKTPRYVKFVEGFPTTASGKIQKFKMAEQMSRELGLTRPETA